MSSRVRVRVEEPSETQTFIFACSRLCTKACYFAKAFGGPYIEAQSRMVILDDIPIEEFRHFSNFILTGHVPLLPLETMVRLYALADRFDSQSLRYAITARLAPECFWPSFAIPSASLLAFLDDNIPQSCPLQALLANAMAKLVYFHDIDLPSPFKEAVAKILSKPYGLCNSCYEQSIINDISTYECEHFREEPADHDPERYREGS